MAKRNNTESTLLDIQINVGDTVWVNTRKYEVVKWNHGLAKTVEIPTKNQSYLPPTPENKHGHCWHRLPDGYSRDGKKPPIENDWRCCHCGRYGDFEGVIPDGHGPHYIGPGIPTFNGNVLTCPGNRERQEE